MIRLSRCSFIVVIVVVAVAGAAQAQVVRGWRGGGLVLRAPFVPQVSVNLRGAIPGVPLVRPYILPRRRLLAAPPYGVAASAQPGAPASTPAPAGLASEAPRFYSGATVAAAGPAATPAPSNNWATPDELAALDDSSLLNSVLAATYQLDADVAKFNTGATWQNYFRLPDDALPQPSADGRVALGMRSIAAALERVDAIAANPKYDMIASLPSFAATQDALREVVRRFGTDSATPAGGGRATSGEELPTPPPSLSSQQQAEGAERSILAK